MRSRRSRRLAVLIAAALLVVAAGAALALWGTGWTIPQAPSSETYYTLRESWDANGTAGGRFERPIGIAVAPSGDVYVTDARLRVVRFSAAGAPLGEWGREGDREGEFRNPLGVAVARDGSVYVSDFEQDRVQKFTASGEFLLAFGRSGSGPGELSAPAGIAVDEDGSWYVADFYNHRVQRFGEDGSFRSVVGRAGRLGGGALHYPTGVAITAQRELVVADAYNYQLQWFDPTGRAVRRAGRHLLWLWPRPAVSTTGFYVPTDVAIGRGGLVHVADSGNHRIVMLSGRGAYLAHWDIPDLDPSVFSPEHIATSPDGSTLYATDLARDRVLVLTVTGHLRSK